MRRAFPRLPRAKDGTSNRESDVGRSSRFPRAAPVLSSRGTKAGLPAWWGATDPPDTKRGELEEAAELRRGGPDSSGPRRHSGAPSLRRLSSLPFHCRQSPDSLSLRKAWFRQDRVRRGTPRGGVRKRARAARTRESGFFCLSSTESSIRLEGGCRAKAPAPDLWASPRPRKARGFPRKRALRSRPAVSRRGRAGPSGSESGSPSSWALAPLSTGGAICWLLVRGR